MPDDLSFPEVFTGFLQSLKLDWTGDRSERAIVSLVSGPGEQLPCGTVVPQQPMRLLQSEETRPGYSSYSKKARELLNKKGHPVSDHLTDALLCAAVFAAPAGAERLGMLNEMISKIRPVRLHNYFVSNIKMAIPLAKFFDYHVGPLQLSKLSSRCDRSHSDFSRLYGEKLAGCFTLESPEFRRTFVDFFDITGRRPGLRTNGLWSKIELLYFEGLAREHFEMMWGHFDSVQALACALGKGGMDPAIFRQKLSRDAHQIAIYLSERSDRGYVVPVQVGLTMKTRIPTDSAPFEKGLTIRKSELGAVIMESAALVQQAVRFLGANRIEDAALYATISLERLFSERGDITDSIARRTAFVCHRARSLSFAKCRGEMHSLYNARSRFVHENSPITQPQAAALLEYARMVLLALCAINKDDRSAHSGFLQDWVFNLDRNIESAGDEGEISDTTLSELGALPAQGADSIDEKIKE